MDIQMAMIEKKKTHIGLLRPKGAEDHPRLPPCPHMLLLNDVGLAWPHVHQLHLLAWY